MGQENGSRPSRVLVTGAAGRLGRLAVAHLRQAGRYQVIATDRVPLPDGVTADLTQPATQWAGLLDDVDAILHCAGHRGPDTTWREAQDLNLDMSLRLMMAARRRVSRFVFLSSNWVMAGHRFTEGAITADRDPDPINPYGMAKLAIERAGVALAEAGDFDFVALRIGMVIADPLEAARRLPSLRRWSQEMWLSGTDFCEGIEKALTAPIDSASVLNLVSDNPGTRWDISETIQRIGYAPTTGRQADVSEAQTRAEDTAARLNCCRGEIIRHLTAGSADGSDKAAARCVQILTRAEKGPKEPK
ncbi:NAD-dependent epimerase/dehydratase family protein [Chelatococcus asaccharovorans]|uniref:NAD-dependent epimerase/dehydratase family protein n=1 Tax=Chelatococcus asaccharovorans TaxID=28210 RepID=UPI00224C73E3|nr:NAD(P)-dependent oxidoreductase [Chelatococcus asaccharovorans]CAH1651171.1 UDP-glucose 4-epimerase [Chelatococcus asaccharovorans]CAH1692771.1 UDP-glucose 4-epimerase [Chelatococcus asaccharovorans]